jgi:hypothetical protein
MHTMIENGDIEKKQKETQEILSNLKPHQIVAYSKFSTKTSIAKKDLQAWCHASIMHFHNNKLCLAIW